MADPSAVTIRIPRWVQLVGLPVVLVLAFMLARPLGHVIFLFLTASVIAFMLNPLVRDLQRLRLPHGLSVGVVYVLFLAAIAAVLIGIGTIAFDQARTAGERIDTYVTDESDATGITGLQEDVDRLQRWLDDHGLENVQIEEQVDEWIASLGAGEISGYVTDALSFAQGAALSVILFLFAVVLVVVISIYMLLDMPRLERSIDRRFPPHDGPPLTQRIERAMWGYVKGQTILSLVIGTSAGIGMWILGTTGAVEGAERYALLFGLWTAFIEVIPYIGPWLSAVPPAVYALFVDPIGVLWVAALFLFIYQVEGHVVVPNVMASALRLHPLLVIFGLLAGGALYGIPGVLVALPTMAGLRAIWEFFGARVELESWEEGGVVPVPVDVEPAEPPLEPPRAIGGGRGQTPRVRPHGSDRAAYASPVSFPATRLRRLRRTDALRALVRETSLSLEDVVMPLFACPGEEVVKPVAGLDGIAQRSVDEIAREGAELQRLGVRAVLLFGIPEEKDELGSGAWDDDGIVQRALRALRAEAPGLTLLTDVCLCEYTSHGHCGALDGGEVANDETLELLARTAVSHVEAGAEAVCPSDMMDGRVGAIRAALPDTPVVSYAAKYASAFYGPFREVAESTPAFGDRRGYQMDPANAREALRECALDLEEGADVLMVKPALAYLDVIRAVRERFDCPVWAYNVSGEYAMVKAAAAAGHLDERQAALESLTAIKRAGAGTIVTYWARDLATWL